MYADDNSLLFMETSAKTAMNVNEIFMAIGKYRIVLFFIYLLGQFCSIFFSKAVPGL